MSGLEDRIAGLEREDGLLREDLWDQWESNHIEHCSREWPDASEVICCWPKPESLV